MSEHHDIAFVPSGRGAARCPSNPAYPDGVALDAAGLDAPAWCVVELPYPAAECGYWLITCRLCGLQVAATAAGRRDDPRSVRLPCSMALASRTGVD